MIDSLSGGLNMPIEHRAGAAATHLMLGAMDIEPFRRCFLSATDLVAHGTLEIYGASSGHRADIGLAQIFEYIADRHAENSVSKVSHLNRGENLNMKIGIKCAQTTQKIKVPLFF